MPKNLKADRSLVLTVGKILRCAQDDNEGENTGDDGGKNINFQHHYYNGKYSLFTKLKE